MITNEDIRSRWEGIKNRCKSNILYDRTFNYQGCSVCDEWKEFASFRKWFLDNLYIVPGQRMEIDKDLLVKGNRVYSPETCCFLPRNINHAITILKNGKTNLPPGVSYTKYKETFEAKIDTEYVKAKKRFYTKEEAFKWYKTMKEYSIKMMAEEYKEYLPEKIYNALMRFEILETDSQMYINER